MTGILATADADPARWLLGPDVDWWDLVRYGPPVFDVHVRIAFPLDPETEVIHPSARSAVDAVRAALTTLAACTTTPDLGYAAIWEGWASGASTPQAPRVEIPHRVMLLFNGPVQALRDAPAVAWYGSAEGVLQEPNLVWPEDHAWCLACEVDEEVEFTVGCSGDAYQALTHDLPVAVRRVHFGEPAPLYRDRA